MKLNKCAPQIENNQLICRHNSTPIHEESTTYSPWARTGTQKCNFVAFSGRGLCIFHASAQGELTLHHSVARHPGFNGEGDLSVLYHSQASGRNGGGWSLLPVLHHNQAAGRSRRGRPVPVSPFSNWSSVVLASVANPCYAPWIGHQIPLTWTKLNYASLYKLLKLCGLSTAVEILMGSWIHLAKFAMILGEERKGLLVYFFFAMNYVFTSSVYTLLLGVFYLIVSRKQW